MSCDHHVEARDVIIAAANLIWGAEAFRFQASHDYEEGDLIIVAKKLNKAIADFTSGATFNQGDWTDLGVAGRPVKVIDHPGDFSLEDIGRQSIQAPAMLIAVLASRANQEADYSNVRFACWIVAENRGASQGPNSRWDIAAQLASQFERWIAKRGCYLDDPILSSADDIRASSVYTNKREHKGYGLWVVTWWMKIDLPMLASDNECLAFGDDAGLNPDGPYDPQPLNFVEALLLPVPAEDLGTDPNFPDNEVVTGTQVDFTP